MRQFCRLGVLGLLLALAGCTMTAAELDRQVARMVQPTGRAVAGWDTRGAAWASVLSREGEPQLLFDADPALPNVTMIAAAMPALPAGWAIVHCRRFGRPVDGERLVQMLRLAPDTLIRIATPVVIDGARLCVPAGSGVELAIAQAPGADIVPLAAAINAIGGMFDRNLAQFTGEAMCFVITAAGAGAGGAGRYRVQGYRPDGRPLGRLTLATLLSRQDAGRAMPLLGMPAAAAE